MSADYDRGFSVGYVAGWTAGKAKAHSELRSHVTADHSAACRCEPCVTVRVIAAQVMRDSTCDACGAVATGLVVCSPECAARLSLRTEAVGAAARE